MVAVLLQESEVSFKLHYLFVNFSIIIYDTLFCAKGQVVGGNRNTYNSQLVLQPSRKSIISKTMRMIERVIYVII